MWQFYHLAWCMRFSNHSLGILRLSILYSFIPESNSRSSNLVQIKIENSKSTKKRNERVKRVADEVERTSAGAIISIYTVTVGKRVLARKGQALKSNLRIADYRSLKGTETNIGPSMKHSLCEDLKHRPSRNETDGRFNADWNNHVLDISCKLCKHRIKASNLNDENCVRSVNPVNDLQWSTLAY